MTWTMMTRLLTIEETIFSHRSVTVHRPRDVVAVLIWTDGRRIKYCNASRASQSEKTTAFTMDVTRNATEIKIYIQIIVMWKIARNFIIFDLESLYRTSKLVSKFSVEEKHTTTNITPPSFKTKITLAKTSLPDDLLFRVYIRKSDVSFSATLYAIMHPLPAFHPLWHWHIPEEMRESRDLWGRDFGGN